MVLLQSYLHNSVNNCPSVFKTPDYAVPRKIKIPVWTEEEGTIRNSPSPSTLVVLHCGASPAFCGRDENEKCILEGKAQDRLCGYSGLKVSIITLQH